MHIFWIVHERMPNTLPLNMQAHGTDFGAPASLIILENDISNSNNTDKRKGRMRRIVTNKGSLTSHEIRQFLLLHGVIALTLFGSSCYK